MLRIERMAFLMASLAAMLTTLALVFPFLVFVWWSHLAMVLLPLRTISYHPVQMPIRRKVLLGYSLTLIFEQFFDRR